MIIADLTGNNPNVFYELSFRHALGKIAIHLAFEGTVLPFDVRDNRTIFYTMHARIVEDARAELANQIRRVHQPEYKPMNPITETADIVNLDRSGTPDRQVLAQLLRSVADLDAQVRGLREMMTRHRAFSAFDAGIASLLRGDPTQPVQPVQPLHPSLLSSVFDPNNSALRLGALMTPSEPKKEEPRRREQEKKGG